MGRWDFRLSSDLECSGFVSVGVDGTGSVVEVVRMPNRTCCVSWLCLERVSSVAAKKKLGWRCFGIGDQAVITGLCPPVGRAVCFPSSTGIDRNKARLSKGLSSTLLSELLGSGVFVYFLVG